MLVQLPAYSIFILFIAGSVFFCLCFRHIFNYTPSSLQYFFPFFTSPMAQITIDTRSIPNNTAKNRGFSPGIEVALSTDLNIMRAHVVKATVQGTASGALR